MLTWMDLVANSTPMVDLDSKLNSFLVNRESRLDFPTPESPIRTTVARNIVTKDWFAYHADAVGQDLVAI